MSTILWEHMARTKLMVLVHSEAAPSEHEWDAYTAEIHELHALGRVNRALVFGEGPGPSARQRQKLHHDGEPVRTAVLSHSVLHRGIVTALSWFYEIKSFAPAELDVALGFLEIPRIEWLGIRKSVVAMRMRLSDSIKVTQSFELTDTIGKLDELVTDRLPKLRDRVRRGRSDE